MVAVATVALVLTSVELARRQFLPPPPRPEEDTKVAWFPGQMYFYSDKRGGYWVSKTYSELDGIRRVHRPRTLTLQYHLRRWGPFTWAAEIEQTIQLGDIP
jgi:hypothetical protein